MQVKCKLHVTRGCEILRKLQVTRGCDIFWENVRFGSAERSVKFTEHVRFGRTSKSGVRSRPNLDMYEIEYII